MYICSLSIIVANIHVKENQPLVLSKPYTSKERSRILALHLTQMTRVMPCCLVLVVRSMHEGSTCSYVNWSYITTCRLYTCMPWVVNLINIIFCLYHSTGNSLPIGTSTCIQALEHFYYNNMCWLHSGCNDVVHILCSRKLICSCYTEITALILIISLDMLGSLWQVSNYKRCILCSTYSRKSFNMYSY